MSNVIGFPGGPPTGSGESLVPIVRTKFLAPERLRRKLLPDLALAHRGSAKRGLLNPQRLEHSLPVAREWLAAIPAEASLHNAIAVFDRALTTPAEPMELSIVAAWLCDSYPNRGAGVGATYVETVEMLLADGDEVVSAASAAAGVKDLVASSKFLPTPMEVIEAVERARLRFWGADNAAAHLLEMRWSAERVVAAAEGKGEPDDGLPF